MAKGIHFQEMFLNGQNYEPTLKIFKSSIGETFILDENWDIPKERKELQ